MLFRIITIFLVLFQPNEALADTCPPSNPSGVDENTLCIKHYIDIIDSKYIDYGAGRLSHFGEPTNPLRPGVGTIIKDKPLPSNEFYTKVSAGDLTQGEGVIVETNKGEFFQNLNEVPEQ